ncbi:hypothetical protein CIB48_g9303, partial [Xylaria polymorpha]
MYETCRIYTISPLFSAHDQGNLGPSYVGLGTDLTGHVEEAVGLVLEELVEEARRERRLNRHHPRARDIADRLADVGAQHVGEYREVVEREVQGPGDVEPALEVAEARPRRRPPGDPGVARRLQRRHQHQRGIRPRLVGEAPEGPV